MECIVLLCSVTAGRMCKSAYKDVSGQSIIAQGFHFTKAGKPMACYSDFFVSLLIMKQQGANNNLCNLELNN